MRPFFETSSATRIIARHTFDLSYSDREMSVRVYEPVLEPDGITWGCRIAIGEPFGYDQTIYQVTGFLALMAALRILSVVLYSSPDWKESELGFGGMFGGDLGIPATKYISDVAPYSF